VVDVRRVAVAGVAVDPHRDVDGTGDGTGVVGVLGEAHDADVGLGDSAVGDTGPREERGVESHPLDESCADAVVDARCDGDVVRFEGVTQPLSSVHGSLCLAW
jgi:hypothetical protein